MLLCIDGLKKGSTAFFGASLRKCFIIHSAVGRCGNVWDCGTTFRNLYIVETDIHVYTFFLSIYRGVYFVSHTSHGRKE